MINILHVDNDPDVLELTRMRLLRSSDEVRVESVDSAEEALTRFEAGDFDCLISDYQMPGMSGLDLLRRLRQDGDRTPFIFLTGQGSEELAAEALREGADDYYPKETGFAHFERLVNSIFKAMERHRERRLRQQTFAEMRESEWRYRLLFTTSEKALTLLRAVEGDGDFVIVDINPTAEALFAVEKRLVIGSGFKGVEAISGSGLLAAVRNVAAGGNPETHEGYGPSHKSVTSNIFKLPSGEVLISSSDVSERRHAMSALRQSEQRYRSLFESSRDMIFITTVEGKFIDVNPRGPELLGYSREELLLNNVEMIYANPKDRQNYKEAIAKKGYLENFPAVYRRKDGGIVHAMLSSTVIADSFGKILGYQGIIRDITKLKEMEEKLRHSESRFRDLAENTNDLVWETDAENRYTYISPRIKDILGFEQNEVIGKTPFDLIAGEEMEQTAISIKQRYDEHLAIERLEYDFAHKDGWLVTLETSTIPKFSDDGTFRGYRGIDRDVSERKKAEDAIKQSESRLRTILDSSPDAVFQIDTEFKIIWANQAAQRIRSASIGGKCHEVFYGAYDGPCKWCPAGESMKRGEIEKRTVKLPSRDDPSQVVYWEAVSVPLKDNSGKITGSIEINRDVTERKRQEETLRKRVRLEKFISHFSRRFFNIDPSDFDVELNHALRVVGRFVGADRAGIFRFSADLSTVSNTHEWCADGIDPQIERIQDLPTADLPWLLEKMKMQEIIRVNDIEELPQEALLEKKFFKDFKLSSILLVPFGHTNSVFGFLGFDAIRETKIWALEDASLLRAMGDIIFSGTEHNRAEQALRESEEKYRNLIERANDGIAIIQDGKFVFVNAKLAELTQYSAQEVLGKPFSEFIAAEELKKVRNNYRLRMTGGDVPLIYETAIIDSEGRRRFVELNAGLIVYEGRPADLVFVRDITERKILQSRLTQAQKLEAIGQLAAGIAHEINTPTQYVGDNINFLVEAFNDMSKLIEKDKQLFASVGSTKDRDALLEQAEEARKSADLEYLSEEVPKALQQSLSGVEQVAKIVRAMKDFSHPGQDEKTATDLNKAIESTITVARNEWKYVADVETDLDENMPLVNCLTNELNQALLNIIVNAAHAIADVVGENPTGEKGKITVSTRRKGDFAEILVSDTGNGIPDKIKSRIFDPFFTTKTVGKGTGQGLSIAHNVIVEKHGGTISFESETGKGTTFTISIPIGTPVL